MQEIDFYSPKTINEAVKYLSQPGSKAIAGGTDIVLLLKNKVLNPTQLVNLRKLDLDYIVDDKQIIRIGSTTPFEKIAVSEVVQNKVAVLAEAAALVGSVQCRNMATIGGNVCSAVPSADSAPPLMVLEALAKIVNGNGERLVSLKEFFVGPRKTILENSDLLIELQIPVPSRLSGISFLKHGRRKALTLSTVNCAAYLLPDEKDSSIIADARVVLGAVAPTPIRASKTEAVLIGQPYSESLVNEAALMASKEIKPISDIRASQEYRIELSRILVVRALREAWGKASLTVGSNH